MDINNLILLDKIAESGNFTRAAEILGLTKASVSNKVRELEQDLGLRLFERSTRSVRITEDGRRIRAMVQPIIDAVRDIEAIAEDVVSKPKGTIRVSASIDVGIYLLHRLIGKFITTYPEIRIELDVSNRYVDLLNENFDLAIRATTKPLVDSDLIAVPLGGSKLKFYAAGTIAVTYKDVDLCDLDPRCLISFSGKEITVIGPGESKKLRPASNIRVNDMLAAKQAVIAGLGVGLLPEFACTNELNTGALVEVFPEWTGEFANIFAVYPSRRFIPRRTTLFLEALKSEFMG